MTRLPAAETAIVDDRKVRDYLLDADHPQNGGKAALFVAFGFDVRAWPRPQTALAAHAAENKVMAVETSRFGSKFRVSCHLRTPDGRNPCITTIWIIEDGAPPRLVTAYR